ncbi:MAG TPA: M48 family metallopeptidase [Terriglobales bacterium]|nr:M48 family metallopeptidase [Terriglobales bacterium]
MRMRALLLAVALFAAVALSSSSALAQDQNPPPSPPSAGQQPSAPPADASPAPSDSSPAATASTPAPATQPNVKPGSKDDVDSIGNRKMGGKGLGNWYSLEKEIQMGKEMSMQVESSVKLVKDPVVNEYINRLGQNLVRNSDAKVPFTIKVIDDDSINAFALPGGFMYVNSGAILAADEEDELAGVMAHEIAHVAARHATREMTRANWANIATIPLIFVGGGLGYAVRSAASLMLPLTFMKFSRGFESEADHLGIEYMYKAGYDPQGLVSYFEKVQAMEKKKPGTLAKAFDSHPQTPDRIAATQHEINTILPARDQYLVDTSEFEDVKARLAAIENKRHLNDEKDNNRPSLRRATAQNHGEQGTNQDEGPPVLKKRDQ